MRRRVALVGLLVAALSCDKPTAPSRGELSLDIRGVPPAFAVTVTVSRAGRDTIRVNGSTLLTDLPAGVYGIHATSPSGTVDSFSVPLDTAFRVEADRTNYLVLRYRMLTGGVVMSASGLPGSDTAVLHVRAPDSTERRFRIPGTYRGLSAGVWTVLTVPHVSDGNVYSFLPAGTFTILADTAPTRFALTYALSSTKVVVRFVGIPPGVPMATTLAALWSNEPFQPLRITRDTVVTGLSPGEYQLRPDSTDIGPFRFRWGSNTQLYLVPASTTPVPAEVRLISRSGAIGLDVAGLPPGVTASVSIRGISGTARYTTDQDTIPFLREGTYVVEPVAFTRDGVLYEAAAADTIVVLPESLAVASVAFRSGGSRFDARIERVTASQAIQTFFGTVPLLAGRPALIRVLALANGENTLQPRVRLRIVDGALTRIDTIVPAAFPNGIRTDRPVGEWASASLVVPGAFVQPGMRVLADLDPDGLFTDSSAANDAWPRDGATGALTVRDVPPLSARFIPIRFGSAPSDVSLTSGIASDLLEETFRLHPVQQIGFDIRSEYLTSQPRPGPGDGATWINIISELEALRVLEGSDRHYVGVMRVNYGTGLAGLGYVGGRTTLIWSDLGSAPAVLAHELGHNFGRLHAPCGAPGDVDVDFPRGNGSIGDLGWNPGASATVPATAPDLMSYCTPAWTSVYTYMGVLAYRDVPAGAIRSAAAGEVLLVSGTITPSGMSLDPAFVTVGAASPPTGGPHRLELHDSTGATILVAAFASEELADAGAGVEHFTLAIPIARLGGRTPASLAVSSAGRRAELRSEQAFTQGGTTSVTTTARADGQVAIGWNGGTARGFVVRDAATGRIITIARRPEAVVPFHAAGYDVTVSDGVRSVTQRVRPAPR